MSSSSLAAPPVLLVKDSLAHARAHTRCVELEGGGALDGGARGWQGVDVAVTDANKDDVLRRAAETVLVRSRFDAWGHLRRGFLGGGGGRVLRAMEEARVPSTRTPRTQNPPKFQP